MVDRKSTRLNSSHVSISYAVFCLKKKTIKRQAKIIQFIVFLCSLLIFFFFNLAATTVIYTLSLHDALPILRRLPAPEDRPPVRMRLDRDGARRRLSPPRCLPLS